MKVLFNNEFNQWQAQSDDGYSAAWGNTKEEAIKNFNDNEGKD